MRPISRRSPASSQRVAPLLVIVFASSARSRTSSIDSSTSDTNAVPRSKLSVTMVTRQPSFSSPTRLATGTRTSSKNTSQNSAVPSMVSSGRMSIPGVSMGTIIQVMPLCFGTSVSVRTSISQ